MTDNDSNPVPPDESRVDWGNPSDPKFPAKIKAWDEGYALGMKRSDDEVAALRAEVERQKRINANAERSRQAAIDCQIEAEKASDALRAERDALRSDFERVNRHWTDAEAEVERMRPVVEAAHDWAYGPDHHPECDPRSDCPACCALGEAARIAHAATGEDARPHVD